MVEFSSVSASSYNPEALVAKLKEKAAEGWDVVAIVPTGGDVTAFLKRLEDLVDAASDADVEELAAAAPAGWAVEQVAVEEGAAGEVAVEEVAVEEVAVEEPAGWASEPSNVADEATSVAVAAGAAVSGVGDQVGDAVQRADLPSTVVDSTGEIAQAAEAEVTETASAVTEAVAEPAATVTEAVSEPAAAVSAAVSEPAAAVAEPTPVAPPQQAVVTTPAGWYPDPSGRFELRYWDGTQWTEHVARGGQQYTDPPVA